MTLRERVARAICAAAGDAWDREGPEGLLDAYGPMADAAIIEVCTLYEGLGINFDPPVTPDLEVG